MTSTPDRSTAQTRAGQVDRDRLLDRVRGPLEAKQAEFAALSALWAGRSWWAFASQGRGEDEVVVRNAAGQVEVVVVVELISQWMLTQALTAPGVDLVVEKLPADRYAEHHLTADRAAGLLPPGQLRPAVLAVTDARADTSPHDRSTQDTGAAVAGEAGGQTHPRPRYWFPRTRRGPADAQLVPGDPAGRLELAWALRVFDEAAMGGIYGSAWRHVIECDAAEGQVRFGVLRAGEIDYDIDQNCALWEDHDGLSGEDYPTLAFKVRCACGLLRVGDGHHLVGVDAYAPAEEPFVRDGEAVFPTRQPHPRDRFDPDQVTAALVGLRGEYLSADEEHPGWFTTSKRTGTTG